VAHPFKDRMAARDARVFARNVSAAHLDNKSKNITIGTESYPSEFLSSDVVDSVTSDRASALYGYEAANKFLQRNIDLLTPKEQKRIDLGRAAYAVMPQPDGAFDVVLDKVPQALKSAEGGDISEIKGLMKDALKIEGNLRDIGNYAPGIEGHHPIELAGSHFISHDVSIPEMQRFNKAQADADIDLGTVVGKVLSLSRPGHNVAHLSPQTNQIGSFGSSKRTASNVIRESGGQDLDKRLELWIPKAKEIQANSQFAYDLPQEQELRRLAGELTGFGPRATSVDRDPNRRANSQMSLANSSRKIISENPVFKVLFDQKRDRLYETMPEPAIPVQQITYRQRNPNKGERVFSLVRDAEQSMKEVVERDRDGVIEALIAMHIDPSMFLRN